MTPFSQIVLIATLAATLGFADAPAVARSAPLEPQAAVEAAPCDREDVSFVQAFSTPIDPVPVLAFVSRVGALPVGAQKQLFDAVVDSVRADPSAVDRALAAACSSTGVSVAAKRGLILISTNWSLGELQDARRFTDFANGFRAAVTALSFGDQIPSDVVNAALAPFTVRYGDAPAAPIDSPPTDDTCASGTRVARVLAVHPPLYPKIARDERVTGTVLVRIDLDKFGFVEAARVGRTTLGPTDFMSAGGDALKEASLVAAAASTYVPGCRGTEPFGGAYLFKADFTAATPSR